MDVIKAVQNYVFSMVEEVPGMKIFLLDKDTTSYVSAAVTQSVLLTKEVYLVDRVDRKDSDKMKHLKCICFVRPTSESFNFLQQELAAPRFGEYHLYFSNIVRKSSLESLAESDEQEVVKVVQEYYADFIAINPDLFSLDMSIDNFRLIPKDSTFPWAWHHAALQRASEGLTSVLLALKKRPLIRYDHASPLCKELAEEVDQLIKKETQLFKFQKSDSPPLLLVIDRKGDPVTPLLTPWTYQAMIHELLGIRNGRVDMSGCPDIQKDLKEVVLNLEQDPFFRSNRDLNFGDLGANIKAYVDEYQGTSRTQASKVESIADMKRFVEAYPEFRRLAGNVTKHVALVGELSRLTAKDRLMEVSELEQSLACNDNHAADLKALQKILQEDIRHDFKVRLALLYALRYEKVPNSLASSIIPLLKTTKVPEEQCQMLETLISCAGYDKRQNDLYEDSNLFARSRNVFRGLKGVENVYTQHQPLLHRILEEMSKGRMKETEFPFVSSKASKLIPQEVIVFIVGGATYQEARHVSLFNQQHSPGIRVVLGGTTIHNSKSFLSEIEALFG